MLTGSTTGAKSNRYAKTPKEPRLEDHGYVLIILQDFVWYSKLYTCRVPGLCPMITGYLQNIR